MSDKRYQVFVSSTYADLRDERSALFDCVSKLDCIPAGMETFPAFDEEQVAYIKKVIDDSDYYVLVIAGRYGSLTKDKVSFTEEEYRYAKDKGLPILTFLHANPEDIALSKTDDDLGARMKLKSFIEEVKTGRNVSFWKNTDDLSLRVNLSLTASFKTRPAVGWVRGDKAASVDLLSQINDLRRRKDELQEALSTAVDKGSRPAAYSLDNLVDITTEHTLEFVCGDYTGNYTLKRLSLSWAQIFQIVGMRWFSAITPSEVGGVLVTYAGRIVGRAYPDITLQRNNIDVLITQFMAYGFITRVEGSTFNVIISLEGEAFLARLNAVVVL